MMQQWAIGVVAVLLINLTNCLANAQTKVAIGYTAGTSMAGVFIAKDAGYFLKHGLDAELSYVAVIPNIPPALIAGSLQIGGIAAPEMVRAIEGGMDIVIIAGGAVNLGKAEAGPSVSGVIARQGLDIKKPQDFVGRKVGVPGIGAAMDISFRKWLVDNGVNLKSVTFVEMSLPQGGDLARGLVDAIVTVEPFFNRVLDSGSGYLVADYSRQLDGFMATMYTATREWVAQNPDAVRGFRAALIEANEFEAQEPAQAKASIAKWTKLPPEAQAHIVLPILKPVVTTADLKFWMDAMVDQGLLNGNVDMSHVIAQ